MTTNKALLENQINIVGGGLAGSEAAWQIAQAGFSVRLYEMRPGVETFAHKSSDCAELVCSNSFRSDDDSANAVGLLHWEMRAAGSLIMRMADRFALPAGGALAVDRHKFSAAVTEALTSHPQIEIVNQEVTTLPEDGTWIFATGPLTTPRLAEAIARETGATALAFFDAIAPIVYADSVDMSKTWFQSRFDKGKDAAAQKAYLNCPMTRDIYEQFIDAILDADQADFRTDKEPEKTGFFEACLPIEEMARRGRETLRFGPFKPIGLTNPHNPDIKPHAVLQLRHENNLGTLYNLVGCQTRMKYGAQADVFRLIPGLENARFARLGGIHRNTFLNAPQLLDHQMRLKIRPSLRFAGQITGVEGYVESAAMGLLAGRLAAAEIAATPLEPPPHETAMGALIAHITGGAEATSFQPMNVNFGLFPPIEAKTGRKWRKARYLAYTERAKAAFQDWLSKAAHSNSAPAS